MSVLIDELKIHADSRGAVFEPLDPMLIKDQQNVHVVISEPGAVRGNHYHLKGKEIISVTGPALVRIREESTMKDINIPSGKAYRLTIPPGVSHAIQNTGDRPNILIAFNTMSHDPENPDVLQDILVPT